ncbi:hypothetical protein HPB52_024698 [Rhipicephalus sanguineus]|uniref:Uncharacterized protein n=1 Tax=Rhipicephalus sanguineus TaxID=34632 RepID=A0A9D4TDZ6_RHISA|nr:hypothetical protein HPB52_024698 [Rhipicephalus sanguineus]
MSTYSALEDVPRMAAAIPEIRRTQTQLGDPDVMATNTSTRADDGRRPQQSQSMVGNQNQALAADVKAVSNVQPYEHLKAIVLTRKTVSERNRLQQLLNADEFGDRRPLQMLHRTPATRRQRLRKPTASRVLLAMPALKPRPCLGCCCGDAIREASGARRDLSTRSSLPPSLRCGLR